MNPALHQLLRWLNLQWLFGRPLTRLRVFSIAQGLLRRRTHEAVVEYLTEAQRTWLARWATERDPREILDDFNVNDHRKKVGRPENYDAKKLVVERMSDPAWRRQFKSEHAACGSLGAELIEAGAAEKVSEESPVAVTASDYLARLRRDGLLPSSFPEWPKKQTGRPRKNG